MDTASLYGLSGIVVSVIIFLVTYKTIIGARKERTKTALSEIKRSLYRNLILEENLFSYEELNRIISSKMIEHNLKSEDLPTENDIMNALYTRLFEDELIEPKIKRKLMDKIGTLIDEENKKIITEEPESDKRSENSFFLAASLLSIMAGMIFTATLNYKAILPPITNIDTIILPLAGTLIGMTFTILLVQTIIKFKGRYTYRSQGIVSRILETRELEEKVYKKLRSYKFENIRREYPFMYKGSRVFLDFFAKKNSKEYVFEIRNVGRILPSVTISHLKEMPNEIKKTKKNAKMVLVTREKIIKNRRTADMLNGWDFVLDTHTLDRLKDI